MASVKKVSYFKMMVPNRPGQGARALGELQKAGINLTAFSGFRSAAAPRWTSFPPSRLPSGRWREGTSGRSPDQSAPSGERADRVAKGRG